MSLMNTAKATLYSDKISKNLGAHLDNTYLGLLLGSASLIEANFGLPFDIRHIAFSGSYLGGLIGTFDVTVSQIFYLFLGVGIIGFVNFIISFSLTLFITFKTRGITFKEFIKSSKNLFIDFMKNPLAYFLYKGEKTIA